MFKTHVGYIIAPLYIKRVGCFMQPLTSLQTVVNAISIAYQLSYRIRSDD